MFYINMRTSLRKHVDDFDTFCERVEKSKKYRHIVCVWIQNSLIYF